MHAAYRHPSIKTALASFLTALALLSLAPSPARAQITSYIGANISNPTGQLSFTWTGAVPLINYQEAGLRVSCNSSDQGQGCSRCCRPFGFSQGGYYYGGPIQQFVTITRADDGALSAVEFQAGDYYNGCAYPGGDGIIYLWALAWSGGNATSFDINVPAGQYVGFSGIFDKLQVAAYVNAYARDLHDPAQPQAIAMDNMRYLSSPCPAFAAPTDIYACNDGTNQFAVSVVGAPTLTYQWQWQPLGDNSWTDVLDGANNAAPPFAFTASGAQTPTLTRTGSLTPDSAALYRCIVSNACSTITSAPAKLAITGAPFISQQPQDQPLCDAPAFAQFIVQVDTTPTDPGPFTYQWQKSTPGHPWRNVNNGENTTGATTPYLNLSLDATDGAGQYRCVITNACATTNSSVATLSFGNGPVIDTQPTDSTLCNDGIGSLYVSNLTETPTSYQWQLESPPNSNQYIDIPYDGTFTDPATNMSFYAYGAQSGYIELYSFDLQQHPNIVRFQAALTNNCGSVTSNPATLTIGAGTPGDLNNDGAIDAADIQPFVNILLTGTSPAASLCAADLDQNGLIDTADAQLFIAALLGP